MCSIGETALTQTVHQTVTYQFLNNRASAYKDIIMYHCILRIIILGQKLNHNHIYKNHIKTDSLMDHFLTYEVTDTLKNIWIKCLT